MRTTSAVTVAAMIAMLSACGTHDQAPSVKAPVSKSVASAPAKLTEAAACELILRGWPKYGAGDESDTKPAIMRAWARKLDRLQDRAEDHALGLLSAAASDARDLADAEQGKGDVSYIKAEAVADEDFAVAQQTCG